MKHNATSADAIDDDFALEGPPRVAENKRKAQAPSLPSSPPAKKKQEQPLKPNEKNKQKNATVSKSSKFVDLSSLSHAAQLDYMNQAMRKTFKSWTQDELSSHTFHDEFIMDPARLSFSAAHDLSNLEPFIQAALPDWQECLSATYNRQTGQPTLLVLTISGQRAADIIRVLPDTNKKCKIMKLFAKHFKITDQADYLAHHAVRTAVGTPHRMSQLVAQDALNLSATRLLLLDVARDQKERNIFEYQDVAKELLEFIHSHCFPYLVSKSMQIIWY